MPIPDFQSLMLPLLELVADGREYAAADARQRLADRFDLTAEERSQLLPSGRQPVFSNRVAWAKAYLTQAGLVTATRRAHFQITDAGRAVLGKKPSRIDIRYLEQFPEFVQFRARRDDQEPEAPASSTAPEASVAPEEALETSYQRIRAGLAAELLDRVKNGTAEFFERLVVELLLKMGYGGSRAEAGRAIGRSGDEGIDGVIQEDRLGLDVIYLQAKKWGGTVGRPEIQKFVGALHGRRARKGVFITTGTFSQEARDYVLHIDPKVVLMDGRQLVETMIDVDLGVTPVATYQLKRIDSDFFADE